MAPEIKNVINIVLKETQPAISDASLERRNNTERTSRGRVHQSLAVSFSRGCCYLWPSSSGGDSWAGSSWGSRAAESEAAARKEKKTHPVLFFRPSAGREDERRGGGTLTCGFSFCTRRMQLEPYTTVFSGTTSHVFTWQHAPMMHPPVRITFLPRSAGSKKAHYKDILLNTLGDFIMNAWFSQFDPSVMMHRYNMFLYLPLDSITLLSPIFRAWETVAESLRNN